MQVPLDANCRDRALPRPLSSLPESVAHYGSDPEHLTGDEVTTGNLAVCHGQLSAQALRFGVLREGLEHSCPRCGAGRSHAQALLGCGGRAVAVPTTARGSCLSEAAFK